MTLTKQIIDDTDQNEIVDTENETIQDAIAYEVLLSESNTIFDIGE